MGAITQGAAAGSRMIMDALMARRRDRAATQGSQRREMTMVSGGGGGGTSALRPGGGGVSGRALQAGVTAPGQHQEELGAIAVTTSRDQFRKDVESAGNRFLGARKKYILQYQKNKQLKDAYEQARVRLSSEGAGPYDIQSNAKLLQLRADIQDSDFDLEFAKGDLDEGAAAMSMLLPGLDLAQGTRQEIAAQTYSPNEPPRGYMAP